MIGIFLHVLMDDVIEWLIGLDPDKNLSMYVTFNPLKPCDIPEYRFLGPDHCK